MIAWLKRLFRRLFHLKEPLPAGELQWKKLSWHRRLMSHFRRPAVSYGSFNMPKFQNCPDCNYRVKRHHKTASGAVYRCRCGLQNFVTHPLIARRERWQKIQAASAAR